MLENIQKQFIEVGDIKLHVITAGPEDGEPVFLLHGFPEFWYGWKHQIPYLAEKGYRLIVPDQRGYNLSDKPKSIKDYHINILAKDILDLAQALGYEKINLVGHDWGAAVSWIVATNYPDLLKKLVILNVPYPMLLGEAWRSFNLTQLKKSWYIFFFQIPGLPEWSLSKDNFARAAAMLRNSSKPDTFSEEDIVQYKSAWGQPNALKSMLNWYRALFRTAIGSSDDSWKDLRLPIPTLMLWGERDVALEKSMAQPSIDLCADGQLIFFPDATHWVQHDEAEAVNQHIHEFLSKSG